MRIRAAREAQKMTRKMVVQKMQQFLPESEKAVTTRSLMSWEAGERAHGRVYRKTGTDTAVAAGLFTARLCRYRSVAGR